MWHRVEKLGEIQIHDPVDRLPHDLGIEPAQGIMTAPPRSKAIRRLKEPGLVDRFQDAASHLLDDLIFRAAHSQRPCCTVLLGNLDPPYRVRPIRHVMQLRVQFVEVCLQMLPIHRFGDPIDSRRLRPVQRHEACSQVVHGKVVHQRRKARLRLAASPLSYPLDSRGRRSSTSACGRRCHRAGNRLCPPLLCGRYSASSLV